MADRELGSDQGSLGTLWVIYGVLRIAVAAFLVVFSGTIRLMAGALLTRVPDPFAWMGAFEMLYWTIIAWCVVCAILSFMAAGALLSRRASARRLAILAAFVSLPEIPFGLVLGIYTLFVFPPRRMT
jgi:hypothetical protein